MPLVLHLRTRGWDVLEVDRLPGWRKGYLMADINYPLDLVPAFDWKPDVVFMLAAVVSRPTAEQAGSLAIATNLGGLTNVLELCKRVNAMCVFFSTSEVYGPDCLTMDEEISDPKPNNRYGLSKLLGEKLVEYEVRTHGLKAVSLRPFMMYDEDEDFGDHRSAMMKFTWRLATGQTIEVHKGGFRGWFHVSDAVQAIEAAAGVGSYMAINIGSPEIVPIETVAEMIRAELGAPKHLVTYCDLPERMTLVKRPVLERQRRVLNFEPRVSLAEGVKLVVARARQRLAVSAAT